VAPRSGNLARFLAYARPYRGTLVLATLAGVLKFNLPIAFPWILKEVVDRVLEQRPDRLGLGLDGLIALGLAVAVAHALTTYWRTRLADRLGNQIVFDVRRDLFTHLEHLPLAHFERHQTGAIASRLVTDVALAQNLISVLGTNVFMECSVLVAVTALLFGLNAGLALVALATLPLYLLVHKLVRAHLRAGSREARERMDRVEGHLHETITAIADVKSFGRESEQAERFAERCRAHFAAAQRNVHTFGLSLGATALLTRLPALLVLWQGAHAVQAGALTVGGLMAFYAYLEMVYSPLTRLGDLNVQLANSRASIDRIFELLDHPPESGATAEARAAPPLIVRAGEIRFEHLSFAYAQGRPALRGIDVVLAPGTRVAIVGPSGAGKSTLVRLLVRFHDPSEGRIRIDGQDIAHVALVSLRASIAVVSQDPVLFSGSISENLRLGRPGASGPELWEALRRAHADDFVRALPGGLEAAVGERGATLSGGQRQRLALARAFLKDAPILVLDEATAHLDPLSERRVHTAMQDLAQGRTTILIAHRASTARMAERLLVLEEGRLVQDGSHEELIAAEGGVYRRLYHTQLLHEARA
jgi:subfamily B ATP-binding cassette protein MsbA